MAKTSAATRADPTPAALIDGVPGDAVPLSDRGLAYADGVFRTLSVVAGAPVAWPDHCARLAYDCQRLGLVMPAPAVLAAEIARLFAAGGSGVAKITLTRVGSGRGYAPAAEARCRRIVQAFAAPAHARRNTAPLALEVSPIALAEQPALAGVKHLARLEQVLARADCEARGARDALMCDAAGRVIATTMRNLVFADGSGRWLTPALTRAGVAGATRARLARARAARGQPLRRVDLALADCARLQAAIAINSVAGVVPVERVGGYRLAHSPAMARAARRDLAAAL